MHLNGKLALHDIQDVEAFTAQLIHRANLEIPWADQEDLHAHLIATCWELSLRYPPDHPSWDIFSARAATILKLRIVDWKRQRYGRTTWTFTGHTHTRPARQHIPLEHADTSRLVDTTPDRSPDLLRVLTQRDRTPVRQASGMGAPTDQRAA